MAPLIIDDIEDVVIERLHARAALNGRLFDDEVLEIIKTAVAADDQAGSDSAHRTEQSK